VKAWARSVIKRSSRRLGYDLVAHHALPPDFSDEDRSIIDAVRPYTMTTPERLVALMAATRYIIARAIPGDIVECGVWRGGSMMATAQVLRSLGVSNRGLYLFDTFTGMPTPGPEDVDFKGTPATDVFRKEWCYAPLDSVQRAVHSVGYDPVRIRFVPGQVERTIPEHAPDQIALLRLDTDWYQSTRHELEHLFPRLSPGGVLIIDDYGHWRGARQAVDEYLAAQGIDLLLHRIDVGGRIALKPWLGDDPPS